MNSDLGMKRLNEALRLRNMNQTELCKRTGLPSSSVSRYLNGKSIPKQRPLALMAEALKVSPAWLMGYDVPMDIEPDYILESEKLLFLIERLSPDDRELLYTFIDSLLKRGNNNADSET